ncbi:hypothetical protein DX933_03310 [Ornithinibacillus gellani]|uniref:UvrB/UvrC motif-containing protein n=1 Tax=Ornithinibacillus gellani TaxID=2293253 RepID=UPI000F48264C|nr:UvrB/UvrC motif-containing protein [Ornithinibacillus gellani]TQS76102.1 hypothetical protein DX933_03310 [Ornithinibacillus gellani]
MECQECHKRPATIHLTQVIHGKKMQINVCEECAKLKGYFTYPEEAYTLHNLLTGLFNFDSPKMESGTNNTPIQHRNDLQCPTCELTFSQFKRSGKFGCATCYDAFSSQLDPILRRVHSGNTKHAGKIPKRKGGNLHLKKQMEDYRNQLKTLIEEEAFEQAAKVRDQIKALDAQIREEEAGDDK